MTILKLHRILKGLIVSAIVLVFLSFCVQRCFKDLSSKLDVLDPLPSSLLFHQGDNSLKATAADDRSFEIDRRLNDRRLAIREACQRHRSYIAAKWPDFSNWTTFDVDKKTVLAGLPHTFKWSELFLVSEQLKMVFSALPKNGNTNIQHYLLKLPETSRNLSANFFDDYDRAKRIAIHNKLKSPKNDYLRPLLSYNMSMAKTILETYTKLTFVRDPFDRLISAWKDMLANRNKTGNYLRSTASDIVRLHRSNATFSDIRHGYGVTFDEMLAYLNATHQHNNNDASHLSNNCHWLPQVYEANLCWLQYDYVGAVEHLNEEFEHIMRIMMGRRDVPRLPKPPSATLGSRAELLKSLNLKLLKNVLIELYDVDYKILGYKMPI